MSSSLVTNNLANLSAIRFLESARGILSIKEHSLLSDILLEWHSSTTFSHLLSRWIPFKKSATQASCLFLNILCFNVRGLERRWGEVCLLSSSHRFDILVLGEVGRVDFSLIGAAFPDFHYFHQSGENAHGGVLVLIHNSIRASRVPCTLSNVSVIDIHMEESTRLVALYAPASKSWHWSDLSPFISARCVAMGDFNVDLEKDGEKADVYCDGWTATRWGHLSQIRTHHFAQIELSIMPWLLGWTSLSRHMRWKQQATTSLLSAFSRVKEEHRAKAAVLGGTCLLWYSPSPSPFGRSNGAMECTMRRTANSLRFCRH